MKETVLVSVLWMTFLTSFLVRHCHDWNGVWEKKNEEIKLKLKLKKQSKEFMKEGKSNSILSFISLKHKLTKKNINDHTKDNKY